MNAGYYSVQGQPAWAGMRGMTTAPTNISYGSEGYTSSSNYFYRNIVTYTNSIGNSYAYYGYHVGYDRNSFDSNLVYHCGTTARIMTNVDIINWTTWQSIGQDVNSVTNNPLFNNPATGDYTLATNSPALSLGFVQIPVSSTGPYQDSLRASWPIVDAPRARGGVGAPGPPSYLRFVSN